MSECIIIVENTSTYNVMVDNMLMDILNKSNAYKVVEKANTNSNFKEFCKKLKIQKNLGIISHIVLKDTYLLGDKIAECKQIYDNVLVLFLNCSINSSRIPYKTLKNWKRQYKNVYYILFYIDIFDHPICEYANYLRDKGIFDLIYSIEENDSRKSGAIKWRTMYSKNEKFSDIVPSLDLYFCGAEKGRGKIIDNISMICEEYNIDYQIDVITHDNSYAFNKLCSGIKIQDSSLGYMPYYEVLNKTLQARCILDIVQDGQKALTLRPYEAVCYNRKLLTNNMSVLEFEYYNPNFIQCFSDPEEIDWEWVKSPIIVDYNYQSDYSPENLYKDICKRLL